MASELYFLMGMVNMSQRAAFEAMEAVYCNKSARALKRLAETALITGEDEVARKYISILDETLYYSKWAREARQYLGRPENVNSVDGLPEIYPDYTDVTIPVGLVSKTSPSASAAIHWTSGALPIERFPDQYVFHVRGEHGATAICTEGNIRLLKAKNEFLGGSMVYPFWHPSGRYCAFSTNKTSQMFHTKKNKRIEVYDTSSDVFIYDCKTNRIVCDSLIMTKTWAENTPAFSHDGKWLYFTTALQWDYSADYEKVKYCLCRVSFNEATGKIGQEADTLINTRDTGKSVSWPRPSYDGRYLMYTQTDYGYFTIWHPEADLWLLDLKTGERRPMEVMSMGRPRSPSSCHSAIHVSTIAG